jgi:hypothetical protein
LAGLRDRTFEMNSSGAYPPRRHRQQPAQDRRISRVAVDGEVEIEVSESDITSRPKLEGVQSLPSGRPYTRPASGPTNRRLHQSCVRALIPRRFMVSAERVDLSCSL